MELNTTVNTDPFYDSSPIATIDFAVFFIILLLLSTFSNLLLLWIFFRNKDLLKTQYIPNITLILINAIVGFIDLTLMSINALYGK